MLLGRHGAMQLAFARPMRRADAPRRNQRPSIDQQRPPAASAASGLASKTCDRGRAASRRCRSLERRRSHPRHLAGARRPVLGAARPEPALPSAAGFAFAAQRFLAFFLGPALLGPPSASSLRRFLLLARRSGRLAFFAFFFAFLAFAFFRFFAMIVLPIVAASVSSTVRPACTRCKTSSCKARACSVPVRAPPRQSVPQRR